MTSQTNANGTYTTYSYDADGNLFQVINYAPGARSTASIKGLTMP